MSPRGGTKAISPPDDSMSQRVSLAGSNRWCLSGQLSCPSVFIYEVTLSPWQHSLTLFAISGKEAQKTQCVYLSQRPWVTDMLCDCNHVSHVLTLKAFLGVYRAGAAVFHKH